MEFIEWWVVSLSVCDVYYIVSGDEDITLGCFIVSFWRGSLGKVLKL